MKFDETSLTFLIDFKDFETFDLVCIKFFRFNCYMGFSIFLGKIHVPKRFKTVFKCTVGWGYYGILTFHPRYDSQNSSIYILYIIDNYSGRTCLSDHFAPIFIVQNLLRSPLLGFEVPGDVIFSQSEIDCPVIPHPHCT